MGSTHPMYLHAVGNSKEITQSITVEVARRKAVDVFAFKVKTQLLKTTGDIVLVVQQIIDPRIQVEKISADHERFGKTQIHHQVAIAFL